MSAVPPPARVLVVAGSDSGGGAGVQADVQTIALLGGFPTTALTALTAQNTLGVTDILPVPPSFVERQLEAVLTDLGADAVKTGMLGSREAIEVVVRVLERLAPRTPVVVDPVMVAKGGARLLDEGAEGALRATLLPRASLLTPNVPEAEALLATRIRDLADAEAAALALLELGPAAVLLKGGHLPSEDVTDLLVTRDGELVRFSSPRIATRSTHGTGCTLAAAAALGIAEGLRLADAVVRAREFVRRAIEAAPGFGEGHGPLGFAAAARSAAP